VRTAEGKLYLIVGIDRTSKFAFVQLVTKANRVNHTIKEATVKRYNYDSHAQLTAHLHDFINAYNYGRRLKTLKGLTPFEYICKIWTIEPDRLTLNPTDQMPGLNT
jgi:Integrase core domain